MLKFVRSFALAVAMMLPFLAQAQTLTVYDGTTTSNVVPAYIHYFDDFTRSQVVYPASSLAQMSGMTITELKFYSTSSNVPYTTASQVEVYLKEVEYTTITALEPRTAGDVAYSGTLSVLSSGSGGEMTIALSVPYEYNGGNLLIGIDNTTDAGYKNISFNGQTVSGASWGGYNGSSLANVTGSQRNFIPKTTFTYESTSSCKRVQSLVASDITNTGATLTWADAENAAGTTYSVVIITPTDTNVVATGLTALSYTLAGLNANTVYTYGVRTDCEGGATALIATTFRTACGVVSAFPWVEDFELYAANTTAIPCMLNEHIEGPGSQVFTVNTTTQSGNATNKLMLPDMSNGTMTKLVLPEMSLNGNYEFIIDVLRNASGASYPGEGIRVFASTDGNIEGATELGFISRNYTQTDGGVVQAESATGWYTYEFPIPITSGTCYIILRGESKYGSATYMDNFSVALAPTCAKPRGLVVEATSSSITLNWSDTTNNGATYSILCIQGSDTLSYTTTTDTTHTFSALPENTTYNFTLRALCSDTDSSRAVTVSSRTLRSGRKMTAFNLTGNARREAPVMDTLAEPYFINAPVWYTDNVSSDMTLTWTVNTGAAVFIDTAGDGSFTCQVTSYSIKNYLQMNTPTVLRVKAEDRNLYTDYTLTLQTETCVAARNLQTAPERIRITATWDCPDTLVTEFHVLISETQLDAEALAAASYTVVNNAHEYTFEGLARETQYYVYVKSACDTTWLQQAVMTQGLGACEEVVIGNPTVGGTSYYYPVATYYKNSFSETIIDAAELNGAHTFTSLSYYYAATSAPSTKTDITIYIQPTTKSTFSSSSDFEPLDATNAVMVYSGSFASFTQGWNELTLSTPYSYDGTSNLMIIIDDNSGSDGTSSQTFRTSTCTGYKSLYWYSDSQNPDINDLASYTGSKNYVQSRVVMSLGYCNPANACPEVTSISADSITNTSAKIVWTAADADYCVGNQIIVSATEIDAADLDAATSVTLAADAVSYNATGLTPDQDYYVYIKTLCNGNEHPEGTSGWATYQFRTFPTCRVPEIVSVTVTGKHTAQLVLNNTGEALGQADNFSYILSTTLLSEADLAAATATANGIDTTVFTLDNLASATTYYIYVQNVCPADNCSSPWSQPDSVLMPVAMPAPINLAAFDQSHNAFSAVWMRDEANFADETAWRAAAALHGQAATDWVTVETAIAGTQPLQAYNLFTGLLADTSYDIYVCAYDAVTGLTSDTVRLDSIRTAVDPGNPTVVGAGDQSNQYVPVYGNYTDEQQRTQSIYPASMLTDLIGQTITGIEYEVRSLGTASYGGWGNYTFNVSLAVTDSANLANGWDATPTTNVYTGTLLATVADGMKITFNTPFVYNGGNLLVSFELPTDENGYANCLFAGSTVENASRYVYGSSYLTAAGTLINFLPQANFRTANESSCYDVTTAYQTGLTGFSADFAWQPGNQETAWQYVINTSDTLTNAELETLAQNVATNSVALTDLLRDTNYTFYLRAACSDTEHSRWTKLPFTTPFEHYDVTVATAVNDAAMGTATGDTVVPDGDTVTLVATPAEGHHFVSWSNGETTDTIRIVATADTTLTATFAANQYTVSLASADAVMGIVEPAGDSVVDYGTEFTATATPAAGYSFVAWLAGEDTVSTDAAYTFTVVSDTALTAHFALNQYTVSLASADAVMGIVEPAGDSIVDYGTEFTATATPAAGYSFVAWLAGEDTVSTEAAYTFTVVSDTALVAHFAANPAGTFTVTVNYDETMGSVEGIPTSSVDSASVVTLTAVPAEHYRFVSWSTGDITATINVTVVSDTTLTATFALMQHTVAATVDPVESGSVEGIPTEAVDYGTTVTLTAVPAEGYHFVEWNNGVTTETLDLLVESDTTVVAKFALNTYTVTTNVTPDASGSVSVSPATTVEHGTIVSLTAIPADGYHFVSWSNGATEPTITVAVVSDTTLTANFELNAAGTYTVTVIYDATMGSVSGVPTEPVNADSVITLVATANDGYLFTGWSTGETSDTLVLTVTGNVTVTANFELFVPATFIVGVSTRNTIMGTVDPMGFQTVLEASEFTATATANDGYRFVAWLAGTDTVSTDAAYTFTVTASVNIEAVFEPVAAPAELFLVTGVSNDENMGFVLGSGYYEAGTEVTLSAQANEGYRFVAWLTRFGGLASLDTVSTDALYTFTVTADVTYYAVFERAPVDIDDVEAAEVEIFAADGRIVVRGAESDIYLYDVNGRVLNRQAAAANVEFTVPATGLYLVKVGNAAAKRVAVVR